MKSTDKRVGDLEHDIKDSHKAFIVAKGFYEGENIGKYSCLGEVLTEKEIKEKHDPEDSDNVVIIFVNYSDNWKGYRNNDMLRDDLERI